MNTHNICFCEEIRKISTLFGWKEHFSYSTVLSGQSNTGDIGSYQETFQKLFLLVFTFSTKTYLSAEFTGLRDSIENPQDKFWCKNKITSIITVISGNEIWSFFSHFCMRNTNNYVPFFPHWPRAHSGSLQVKLYFLPKWRSKNNERLHTKAG